MSISAAVSDLFFNFEKDNYIQTYDEMGDYSEEDLNNALLEDSRVFCNLVECGFGVPLDPIELFADYISRV